MLIQNGVEPGKIVVCHSDVEPDIHYKEAILNIGAFIEFDNFGKEFVIFHQKGLLKKLRF